MVCCSICYTDLFQFSQVIQKPTPANRPIVAVEGMPGAGKSALLAHIDIYEPPVFDGVLIQPDYLTDWQHVDTCHGPVDLHGSFNQNPKEYAFQLQQKIMLSFANREREWPPDKNVPIIMERSLDSLMDTTCEVMFQNGWLSPSQMALVRETGTFLRDIVPLAPTGIIYLDVEVEEAMARLRRRGHKRKDWITEDYLMKLKLEETKWINLHAEKVPLFIRLDANQSVHEVCEDLLNYETQLRKLLYVS